MRREQRSGRVPSKQKQNGSKRRQSPQYPTRWKSHKVDIMFVMMKSSATVKRELPILGDPVFFLLVTSWHQMNENSSLSDFTALQMMKLSSVQHPVLFFFLFCKFLPDSN